MLRTYRMYGFVPYNISPIQQGIQFGHGVVEYGILYGDTPEYKKWSKVDKTFIILNGGTTNYGRENNYEYIGSLNQIMESLRDFGVRFASFNEPDLGDQLTAVVFLVDDRVWDNERFPDYSGAMYANGRTSTPDTLEYSSWLMTISNDREEAKDLINLRNFLRKYRLA